MPSQEKIIYPVPPQDRSVSDNYFGTVVADPYRPLENRENPELKKWIQEENRLTEKSLSAIPFRSKVKNRITELYNYPKYGIPAENGGYYYFFRNDGMQEQPVLYRHQGLKGEAEVFLDPNKLSGDSTASVSLASFSKDERYMAYSISSVGSDWSEIRIMDTRTGQELKDRVKWVKFSGAVWCEGGFYYSGYDAPVDGEEYSGINKYQKVFFHKTGTQQSEDILVYEDMKNPLRYHRPSVSEDGKYLLITSSEGTAGSEIIFRDRAHKEFKTLFKGFGNEYEIVRCEEDKVLIYTNEGADNYHLIMVNLKEPETINDIIPESADFLQNVTTAGGYLFAFYLKDVSSRISQYDMDGRFVREIELPGIGTAEGLEGKKEQELLFYSFSSFNYPSTIFSFDTKTGESKARNNITAKFNPEDYIVEQRFYTSKDGSKVPLFLTYKKGLPAHELKPVLLYGYGGFNISVTPSFNPANIVFLEQGGIYAVANIRGGGEYGEKWHRAGMLERKQAVFDDFIAAAEYLIEEGYTTKEKLAIMGGSNGGLLVGACVTQRPDLFAAAIPRVGVLDMLRYHKFTVGWGWAVEYGSSDYKEQFEYLYKYSPLHNIREGECYPATMIMTGDHDDRVVPAHSYKFAAALQKAQGCGKPVLLRVETSSGHGAGKPVSKIIDESADMWAFVMNHLNIDFR